MLILKCNTLYQNINSDMQNDLFDSHRKLQNMIKATQILASRIKVYFEHLTISLTKTTAKRSIYFPKKNLNIKKILLCSKYE